MKSNLHRSWILLLVSLVLAVSAYGQGVNATLTGMVQDATQAVVPNANITLKNVATGDVRKTVTNTSGYFSFSAVPSGEYALTVEAAGFQTWERTGLTFAGADRRTLNDIILQVGSTAEKIEVTGAVEILTPIESGERSTILTTKQLQDFTVVGRSAAEFIKIMPGVAISNGVQNRANFSGEVMGINGNGDAGSQSALNNAFSANGLPSSFIDITADGAHVSDPGCNCATPVNPNTDMIQEFKLMTNSFSAENSKGPIVLNTVAKAGTRDFHGMAYSYVRHHSMNSNDWIFNSQGTAKPENRFIFPGGNISGPVILPGTDFNRNRDKLFFFTGFEYYLQRLDTGLMSATVPTEGMRQGNFSPAELAKWGAKTARGAAPNQVKADQFPGGIIPQSAWFPGANNLLNLYPLPNKNSDQTGGYNYVDAVVFDQNGYQSLSRVDYSISDNTKLFVRANIQNETQHFPVSLWWRNGGSVPYPTPIESPNTSKSTSTSLTHVFNPTLTNEFVFGYTFIDFPNMFAEPEKIDRSALGFDFKGIYKNGLKQIPSLGSWGNELATIFNPGGFEAGHGNLYATKHLLSFGDNVSKVWGTHTMKFGAYYEYIINTQPGNGNTNGWAIFDTWQGSSSGNTYADLLLGRPIEYQETNLNPPHNEAYKLFEFYLQDSWKVIPRLTLDLGIRFHHMGPWYDRQGIGFAIWDPASYKEGPGVLVTDYPGVLWNKRSSAIPNAGMQSRALFFAPRFGLAWDIFGNGRTVLRGGWGMFRFHTAQTTQGLDPAAGVLSTSVSRDGLTFRDAEAVVPAYSRSSVGLMDRFNEEHPLTYNYNFTLSQRLPGATQWEIAYVGSQSRYLGWGDRLNMVKPGTLWQFEDPNVDSGVYDDLRQYKLYQDINIQTYKGYSNYNSLQTTLMRQKGRWNYQFNYTWSKALGIGGTTNDYFNIDNAYGILPYDRTHIFNAAYSVEMPDAIKGGSRPVAKQILNGWQLSGIMQLQSGPDLLTNSTDSRFNVAYNNDLYTNATILGTKALTLMPLVTCDPRSGLAEGQYINGNCFAVPTARGVNGPNRLPAIRGPAFFNTDLSLFKNFQLPRESQKLQFRFSAYNFMNHAITSFRASDDNALKLNFDENTQKLTNARFGFADYKYGHRVIQLALKFYF